MAGSGGSEADTLSLPGWRLSLLLVGFLLISLFAEKFFHWIQHAVSGRKGLVKALESLKTELLLLGLLSLLLVPLTEPLSAICVPSKKSLAAKYKGDGYGSSKDSVGKSGGGYRRLLWDRFEAGDWMRAGRALLAATCGSPCKEGKEPFWTTAAIHDTHLLLFFAAVVYICYTTLTMSVCLWKVHTWRTWEETLRNSTEDANVVKQSVDQGAQSCLSHWLQASLYSVTQGVTKHMYGDIRRLYIKQMHYLDNTVDFQSFVRDSIELQLAECFKTEWVMWLYAAVLVAIPSFVLAVFWTAALSGLLMAVMGAKLSSIAIKLTEKQLLEDKLEVSLETSIEPVENNGRPALGRLSLQGFPNNDGLRISRGDGKGYIWDKFWRPSITKDKGSTRFDRGPPNLTRPSPARPNINRTSLGRRSVKSVPGTSVAGSLADNSEFESDSASVVSNKDNAACFPLSCTPRKLNGDVSSHQQPKTTLKKLERQRSRSLLTQGDAKALFWLGRPQLLLKVFRFILFQNAMNITLAGFSLNKGYKGGRLLDWGIQVDKWLLAVLVVLDVLLALHAAAFVLPMYALLEMVGSHSPKSLLSKAMKYTKLRSKARRAMELVDEKYWPPVEDDAVVDKSARSAFGVLKSVGDSITLPFWRVPGAPGSSGHADGNGRASGSPKAAKASKSFKTLRRSGLRDNVHEEQFLHRLLQNLHDAAQRQKLSRLAVEHVGDAVPTDIELATHSKRPGLVRSSLPDLAIHSIRGEELLHDPEVISHLDPVLKMCITRRKSMQLGGLASPSAAPPHPSKTDPAPLLGVPLVHSHSTPSLLYLAAASTPASSTAPAVAAQEGPSWNLVSKSFDQPSTVRDARSAVLAVEGSGVRGSWRSSKASSTNSEEVDRQ